MKINKWTAGLAAAGVVSLASVAQAEESSVPLLTALSATTLSGYVDTSVHWNLGRQGNPPGTVPAYGLNMGGKNDGFNVNSVVVSVEKPLDEGLWSSGYRVDLQWGEDAGAITGGFGALPVRQAYVDLRAPVGSGLDFRIGRFDTIIGYESSDSYKNPNYTRSYGYAIEPTTHTGVLLSYHLLDWVSVNAGIANSLVATPIGFGVDRSGRSESHKTYMASVTFTMPDDAGFLAGSGIYAGIVDGFGGGGPNGDQTSYFAGATFATPVAGLRLGLALDHADNLGGVGYATAFAGYASFQASEAVGFHIRSEYAKSNFAFGGGDVFALTGTVDYALWQNVLTRAEIRWDRAVDGTRPFRVTPTSGGVRNELLLAANVVYKF